MKMKKVLSCVLALAMVASLGVTAFAEQQSSTIQIEMEASVMSVTVPTTLPISLSSEDEVDATIINNSETKVEVTGVRVEPATGWGVVSWDTDWSDIGIGAREFAFKINGKEVASDGSVDASSFGKINGNGGTLDFTYQGRVAPQNGSGTADIGYVVFTLGWVELMNFTVSGSEYQAEEGMTWAQWIASSHNTSK